MRDTNNRKERFVKLTDFASPMDDQVAESHRFLINAFRRFRDQRLQAIADAIADEWNNSITDIAGRERIRDRKTFVAQAKMELFAVPVFAFARLSNEDDSMEVSVSQVAANIFDRILEHLKLAESSLVRVKRQVVNDIVSEGCRMAFQMCRVARPTALAFMPDLNSRFNEEVHDAILGSPANHLAVIHWVAFPGYFVGPQLKPLQKAQVVTRFVDRYMEPEKAT